MKTIYTLHENGAPSHFYGLDELARINGYKIRHREISQRNALKKLLFEFNFHIVSNIIFLSSLPFRKRTKVVLAIAPYNGKVGVLMRLLKKHEVYYFTSYTCWDQSLSAHNSNPTNKLLSSWRYFTASFVKHIFAVSAKTKQEMIKNGFASQDRISVVNHSLREEIYAERQTKSMSFIQVSRLTEAKGILEIIEVFKYRPEYSISFAGSGSLQGAVKQTSNNYDNINYLGYIGSFDKLVEQYKKHSFVLLNSRHIPNLEWEELFGIALIEGMACGCVPVASDHSGPKEIIEDGVNGLLYNSDDLASTIDSIASMSQSRYQFLRQNAIRSASKYLRSNIAERWRAILD